MERPEEHEMSEAPVTVEGGERMEDEASDGDVFIFPASFSQQRLWFLDQLEPASPAYNISSAIRLRGPLDVAILARCLTTVVDRHESLRTGVAQVEGKASQIVRETVHFELPSIELRTPDEGPIDDTLLRRKILRLAHEDASTPFDISRGPLFRAKVLVAGEHDHVVLVTVHHIIADGWSMGVLYSEISQLYAAYVSGRDLELPELPIQFVDYTIWQQEFVESEEVEHQLDFWRSGFGGTLPVLELPKKSSRPAARSSAGAKEWLTIDGETVEACREICRSEQATPYMFFLAVLKVLLHKYSGQDDVIVGSPIANRSRAETETSVGFYANTVAYRTDLSGGPSFREVLRRVRDFSKQVYANQDVPFERVVEALNPDRDLSHNPLFQAMFTMQASPDEWLQLPGVSAEFLEIDNSTAKFDLLIELQEKKEGIAGYFEYSTEIFDGETIARMVRHYRTLLGQLLENPEVSIDEASVLSNDERRLVLDTWNDTLVEAPSDPSVQSIFRRAAREFADAPAMAFGDVELSYAELDRRSSQLARLLVHRGVENGDFVGVCFDRSLEMVVAVVAALKAGAAYVPIDPGYPSDRRAYLVEDAGLRVLLTNLADLAAPDGVPLERIDSTFTRLDELSEEDPGLESSADDVAYVIYTSGSTGKPKGVTMRHGPLSNLIAWQLGQSVVGRGGRTLQFASLSFDVSFQEIFATFASGGILRLVTDEVRKDPSELLRLLKRESVERIFLPYIALQQLAEVGELETIIPEGLREVITAGEQLHVTPSIVRFFSRLDGCTLTNQYGPTESHVVTSYRLEGLPHQWPSVPPIGRPIANARIYVLDRRLEPVPVGVTGELFIAGNVLASGYHERPDLTADRFVDDPFVPEREARMYRTGDLARFRSDGEIEFLGRNDYQVKIRGYRVEPDEVEAALNQVSGVQEAFVGVEGEGTERRLVAYVVPSEGRDLSSESLQSALHAELPEYMIPSAFFALDEPPLTPSGKVARGVLSRSPSLRPLGGVQEVVEARTDTERTLSKIWKDVLGNESIGIRDNFFDLGGHSILAVRLMSRVGKDLRVELPLATLFRAPTIEDMGRLVDLEARASEQSGDSSSRARDRVRAQSASLVLMHEGNHELPLFCVHGVGGNVLRFSDLVRGLGEDQTCYGLQARGADGLTEPHDCLREMAASYVEEVEEAFPEGPYLICGYSSGGVIAFEMAKQLTQAGKRVGLLALFDTYHPEFYADDSDRILLRKRYREEGLLSSVKEFFRIFWRHQKQRLSNQKLRAYRKLGRRLPQSLVPHSLALAFYEAAKRYEAGDYSGEILLFRTTANAGESGEDLGWSANAKGGVRVVSIPGNHDNFLLEPHVSKICEALKPEIANVPR